MIICRGTNDTNKQTNTQIFTSIFRDKLSLQGARIGNYQEWMGDVGSGQNDGGKTGDDVEKVGWKVA